jgi:hypothetical protein
MKWPLEDRTGQYPLHTKHSPKEIFTPGLFGDITQGSRPLDRKMAYTKLRLLVSLLSQYEVLWTFAKRKYPFKSPNTENHQQSHRGGYHKLNLHVTLAFIQIQKLHDLSKTTKIKDNLEKDLEHLDEENSKYQKEEERYGYLQTNESLDIIHKAFKHKIPPEQELFKRTKSVCRLIPQFLKKLQKELLLTFYPQISFTTDIQESKWYNTIAEWIEQEEQQFETEERGKTSDIIK